MKNNYQIGGAIVSLALVATPTVVEILLDEPEVKHQPEAEQQTFSFYGGIDQVVMLSGHASSISGVISR